MIPVCLSGATFIISKEFTEINRFNILDSTISKWFNSPANIFSIFVEVIKKNRDEDNLLFYKLASDLPVRKCC